jgi:hypothetical protein
VALGRAAIFDRRKRLKIKETGKAGFRFPVLIGPLRHKSELL